GRRRSLAFGYAPPNCSEPSQGKAHRLSERHFGHPPGAIPEHDRDFPHPQRSSTRNCFEDDLEPSRLISESQQTLAPDREKSAHGIVPANPRSAPSRSISRTRCAVVSARIFSRVPSVDPSSTKMISPKGTFVCSICSTSGIMLSTSCKVGTMIAVGMELEPTTGFEPVTC